MGALQVHSSWGSRVVDAQASDFWVQTRKGVILKEPHPDWTVGPDGGLRMRGRLVVPRVPELRRSLFDEAHRSRYTVHPGTMKMYKDIRRHFWWKHMRTDVADYVSRCFTCQQVKAEHRRPGGLLQPLPVPEWKWASISMDFIVGLPRTRRGNDSIWVIVDRLTKSAHFLPVRATHSANTLAQIYV